MISKLIRPVAVTCSLAMLLFLYLAARKYPGPPRPQELNAFFAIVSVLPIGFTAVGLCFARKEGPFFFAYCAVLLLTGYSMLMTMQDDYFTMLFMRSLFAWGSFVGCGFLALVGLVLFSKSP